MTEDFDDPQGIYFMRARFYDPDTGRFLGKDPVEGALNNPIALHKYVYAGDTPMLLVDPSGKAPSVLNIILGRALRSSIMSIPKAKSRQP